MTVREWLEKLFGSSELDKELEPGSEPTKEEVKKQEVKEVKKEEVVKEQPKVEPVQQVKEIKEEVKEEPTVNIFEMGWFDEKTGSIDFSKIKNPEVKSAFKLYNSKIVAERQARSIEDAIGAELVNYAITVTPASIKRMLDTSAIKVDDKGQVIGVKEAIENLKKTEPGIFKDKDKVSSPLNEGFNPPSKSTVVGLPNSLEEAIAMDAETASGQK